MRQAENTGNGPVSANGGRVASPIKVGAAVLAVALAAWGLLWLTTRPNEPTGGRVDRGPAFALTNAEAIARFKELDSLRLELYRERDVSLIPQFLTPDSPLRSLIYKEIDQLQQDNVSFRGRFVTRELDVVINDGRTLVMRHVVEAYPRIVTDEGEEVTSQATKPTVRTIEWTLRLDASVWKVYNSDTTDTQPLRHSTR